MVAPFRKKNTVEQTFFRFNENFFNYFSNQYLYEDINEIRIARSKFELKVIGVGSDYSYAIATEIKMNNYEILKITEQPTFFSKEDLSKIKYIEDFIAIALKKSLRNRLKKYTEQVELNKYFSYSDWFFYVEDRVLFDIKNNKKYQINSINIQTLWCFRNKAKKQLFRKQIAAKHNWKTDCYRYSDRHRYVFYFA